MSKATETTASSPAASRNPLMVHSVEKAFRILEALSASTSMMGLTALEAATGMNKSTVQRFTHTLEELGYLEKDPETRRFSLAPKVLDFSYGYFHANELFGRAMPYLTHLSKTTEETINITVREGTEVIFVTRFMNRHLFNTDVTIGTRMPVYCTAPGIAMLAYTPREEAVEVLKRCDRKPITDNTCWEMDDLLAKLDVTKARGYATAFEEFYHDDLSISAPVFDAHRKVVAAITLSVSRSRYTPEQAEEKFSSLVVAAARSVSQPGHFSQNRRGR